ncbi:MAG: YbaY family lipoprotein [bacterium]
MSDRIFAALVWFALASRALAQTQETQLKPVISEDRMQLSYREKVLLDGATDGMMSIHSLRYAPEGEHFLVIGCGFECNDNVGFLFKAEGSGKRRFTERWDYILQDKAEWSADGQKIFYYRINSSGAEPPAAAPVPGWIEFDVKTGRKSPAASRRLKTTATYAVFRVGGADVLKVRIAPGTKSAEVGAVPHDATGLKVTGPGKSVGRDTWVPVRYQDVAGWVNQSYLYEEAPAAEEHLIKGTVTYRERVALLPGAILKVSLVDVSRADAPAVVISTKTITPQGSVPIAFELSYNPARIEARHTYAVQALLESGGKLWMHAQQYRVLAPDSPATVEISLQAVK